MKRTLATTLILVVVVGSWRVVRAFSPATTTTTRRLVLRSKPCCQMASTPPPPPPPPGNPQWKNTVEPSSTSSSSPAAAAAAAANTNNNNNCQLLVQQFVDAFNYNNDNLRSLLLATDDVVLDDYNFYFPCIGINDVERQLRLQAQSGVFMVVDDQVISSSNSNSNNNKAGIQFHLERRRKNDNDDSRTTVIPNSRGILWFDFLQDDNNNNNKKIIKLTRVMEMAQKNGEKSLALLTAASPYMKTSKNNMNGSSSSSSSTDSSMMKTAGFLNTASFTRSSSSSSITNPLSFPENNNNLAPVRYFQAWNRRDMKSAVQVFADDCIYDDTAFANILQGKKQVEEHLLTCAKAFPLTFTFEMDDLIQDNSSSSTTNHKIMTQWHVEDDGEVLPFTRGVSLYKLSPDGKKIRSGIDFVGPAPFKTGSLDLIVDSLKIKFSQEPARLIPAVLWLAYMYIVFFSDGILPGANALQLEQRTWEEVRDLSLNFFLVAPTLQLPFSPTVHPMLEGVFNLLLSWAAMFAGFFSDERREKPNLLPIVPTVVGMQFLTSAFFLPYLVTRTSEPANNKSNNKLVKQEDLSGIARVCESRALGPFMAIVGSYSIVWAIVGRHAEFGSLSERWGSFLDLLSIDRVGSSFLVDLAIFGLFQGWLIDDDVKRRGGDPSDIIVLAAKYLPFFGLAVYLALRPAFPSQNDM